MMTYPGLDDTTVFCRLAEEAKLEVSWPIAVNAEAIDTSSRMGLHIVLQESI